MKHRGVVALVVLAACGDPQPAIRVVLDLPLVSSGSYPFGPNGIDAIRLAVAQSGVESDLVSTKQSVGDDLGLTDIPFGRGLVLHVFGEQSGVEVAYGRSCAFDFEDKATGLESIHVYFSRLVRFGEGPTSTVINRRGGHLFERDNDSVVFAGGDENADLEFFNPRSGELTTVVEAPQTLARQGGVLATIAGDRAVLVGGVDSVGAPVASIELLPDLRDSLESGLALRDHAATSLVSGDALVAGGELWNGTVFVVTRRAWEVSVDDGGLVAEPRETGSMAAPRAKHSLTRLSDEFGASVLVAGGLDPTGSPVASAEVYRPLSRLFEPVAGTLLRWDHQAKRLPGGEILIIGGFQPNPLDGTPEPARDLVLFDPIGGSFQIAGQLPADAPVTQFTLTSLPDERVLMTGGILAGGAPSEAAFIVRLDTLNGLVDVATTDSMSFSRELHAATRLCDGTVLITGGTAESQVTERYNPLALGRR